MLSTISPQSADIIDAVPTATSLFALPGWDENPAEVDFFAQFNGRLAEMAAMPVPKEARPAPKPNAKLIKKEGGGFIALSPEDIPFYDDGPPVPYPHMVVKRFDHTPTITYRCGDETVVVTGPIEPTIPHTTKATRAGWEKWFGDRADHTEAAVQAFKTRNQTRKRYFKKRADDKEAAWDAKCERALAKGKPLPERPKFDPPPDWMNYVKDPVFVAMMNEAAHCRWAANRMREFEHKNMVPIAGRVCKPFKESFEHEDGTPAPAIRSWQGPIFLSLLSSALPKGTINFGYDKEVEYSSTLQGLPRLFVLDMSHIVLDKSRRCCFIVDLDGWWVDLAALRSQLRKLLPPEFMPNCITYRGADDGKGGVENPHLVWCLPPGSRVIPGKGQKKLRQQYKLHEMVQAGIVSHLIPLGADPGHTNTFKTKNPLSPGYSIEICDDHFQTMDDWRSFLPTITPDKREMKRRAKIHKASQQSGAAVNESQAAWNDGLAYRCLEIKAGQYRKDPAFLAARKRIKTFVDWLYNEADGVVTTRLIGAHGDTRAVRSVLREQREYVTELAQTPSAVGLFYNHGRDADINAQELPAPGRNATAEERKTWRDARKGQGGRRSRQQVKDINCGLICEEIESRMAAGIPVIKSEVVNALVKAGTVKRSTAYNRFDECLRIVQQTSRYQDMPFDDQSTPSGQQIEAVPVSVSETVSGNGTTLAEPAESPVTVAQVENPAQPHRQTTPPPWVVDKDSLIEWEDACEIREIWRLAVAQWRKAQQQQPSGDVDLVDDEKFRAMVLDRSVWSHRQH